MTRWRQFVNNAGKGGVARTLIVGGLFLFIGFAKPEFYSAGVTFLTLFLLPRLFRTAIVDSCNAVLQKLGYFGWGIFALALGGDYLRQLLDDKALVHLLCAIIGAYLGLYFWLMSDPEIAITHEPKS